MNQVKIRTFRKVWRRGPVTEKRVMSRMPDMLIAELPGRLLGVVAALAEAAYLDGFAAAGGDTTDTIPHRNLHARALLARLGEVNDE